MREGPAKWRADNLVDVAALVGTAGAVELQQIARSLARLDVLSCNEGLTERQEKREEKLERVAAGIAERHGFHVYRQGDPRGWPLYLWSDAALAAYKASRPEWNIGSIASCYPQVGVAVCPH